MTEYYKESLKDRLARYAKLQIEFLRYAKPAFVDTSEFSAVTHFLLNADMFTAFCLEVQRCEVLLATYTHTVDNVFIALGVSKPYTPQKAYDALAAWLKGYDEPGPRLYDSITTPLVISHPTTTPSSEPTLPRETPAVPLPPVPLAKKEEKKEDKPTKTFFVFVRPAAVKVRTAPSPEGIARAKAAASRSRYFMSYRRTNVQTIRKLISQHSSKHYSGQNTPLPMPVNLASVKLKPVVPCTIFGELSERLEMKQPVLSTLRATYYDTYVRHMLGFPAEGTTDIAYVHNDMHPQAYVPWMFDSVTGSVGFRVGPMRFMDVRGHSRHALILRNLGYEPIELPQRTEGTIGLERMTRYCAPGSDEVAARAVWLTCATGYTTWLCMQVGAVPPVIALFSGDITDDQVRALSGILKQPIAIWNDNVPTAAVIRATS